MPITYQLISSNVLSSSALSVTFSSIPATYTDLVVRINARKDTSNNGIFVRFNGVTTSSYIYVDAQGTGSIAASSTSSFSAYQIYGASNMDTDLASTFANSEMYIPSYTTAINKPIASQAVRENNTTTSAGNNVGIVAGLFSNTGTISSILLTTLSANFVAGSSFYLYGIKNS